MLVEAMVREKVEQEMREEGIGGDPDMNALVMQPHLIADRVREKYDQIMESVNAQ